MTPEQRDVTRNALRKYGERHWARTPENRRWQSAIDEGLDYYQAHDPMRQTCCGCAFLSSARRTRS